MHMTRNLELIELELKETLKEKVILLGRSSSGR